MKLVNVYEAIKHAARGKAVISSIETWYEWKGKKLVDMYGNEPSVSEINHKWLVNNED